MLIKKNKQLCVMNGYTSQRFLYSDELLSGIPFFLLLFSIHSTRLLSSKIFWKLNANRMQNAMPFTVFHLLWHKMKIQHVKIFCRIALDTHESLFLTTLQKLNENNILMEILLHWIYTFVSTLFSQKKLTKTLDEQIHTEETRQSVYWKISRERERER